MVLVGKTLQYNLVEKARLPPRNYPKEAEIPWRSTHLCFSSRRETVSYKNKILISPMRKKPLQNIALIVGSSLLSLLLVELVVRNYIDGQDRWKFENLILKEAKGDLIEHHFRGLFSYDSTLGWVPMPNTVKEKWGLTVTTLNDGIRSNGNIKPLKSDVVIMAFGCSFTFGDEVADYQTWPAILQKITGYNVLNAGVSSYGLDQSILRAQKLVPKYKPDIIIISLIYEDLSRCRQSVRHGVPKPYFVIENKEAVLKNCPIPYRSKSGLDYFRTVFGYSYFVHKLMSQFFPAYWWKETIFEHRYVHSDLTKVILSLFKRLEKFTREGMRVVILIQENLNVNRTRLVVLKSILREVKREVLNVEICNIAPNLFYLKEKRPDVFLGLFLPEPAGRHMSQEGNTFVALMLKEFISQSKTRD